MSLHFFEPTIAKKTNLNAAIIFQNIKFWIEKNAIDNRNLHDGCFWTYNSNADFAELLPYLSADQIRRAIDRLIKIDLLIVGNYNKDKRDRTRWYSINWTVYDQIMIDRVDSGSIVKQKQLALMPDARGTDAETQVALMPDARGTDAGPLPYINNRYKPDNKKHNGSGEPVREKIKNSDLFDNKKTPKPKSLFDDSAASEIPAEIKNEHEIIKPDFDQFWLKIVEQYRRAGCKPGSKAKARAEFEKQSQDSETVKSWLIAAERQANKKLIDKKTDGFSENFPHVIRWLKDERYNDEFEIVEKTTPPPSMRQGYKHNFDIELSESFWLGDDQKKAAGGDL